MKNLCSFYFRLNNVHIPNNNLIRYFYAFFTYIENERETPPVFVRTLVPIVCRAGSSMSLICKVEGTPLPTVQWYKDGMCVDTSPNYTTTYNNGEAVLSVDSLKPEDQGLYSCKATNRLGSESTAANLTVECKFISYTKGT